MKRLVIFTLVLPLLTAPTEEGFADQTNERTAGGYTICTTSSGKNITWSAKKMNYKINKSGGPSKSVTYIKRAANSWTKVSRSKFKFRYKGTSKRSDHGSNDGVNLVSFGSLSAGTVGINVNWYSTTTGYIVDSDIRFNTLYDWTAKRKGSSSAYDVQNVATHEFGHSLCLKDLYGKKDKAKTMYGYVSEGMTKQRSLHSADKRGIRKLY